MELDLDIQITANSLYDYQLRHTYTSFQGILGAVAGLFLIALFLFMGQSPIFLVMGLVVEAYLPITLFLSAKKQFISTPVFKKPIHYHFDDTGMTVSQDDASETQEWDVMFKAVSTPSSIILYTSRRNASIFPKKDLGDQKSALIEMISTHMSPKKVKIRG